MDTLAGAWGGAAVASDRVPGPAFLSNDINRYVWDGRVQAAGINPYRYFPADPALAALRDATVFPFINRADTALTIYPPAARHCSCWCRNSSGVFGIKCAWPGLNLRLSARCCSARARRAAAGARADLRVAPLPVWEFAGNGHVDALAIAWVALALLAAVDYQDPFGCSGRLWSMSVLRAAAALAAPVAGADGTRRGERSR